MEKVWSANQQRKVRTTEVQDQPEKITSVLPYHLSTAASYIVAWFHELLSYQVETILLQCDQSRDVVPTAPTLCDMTGE